MFGSLDRFIRKYSDLAGKGMCQCDKCSMLSKVNDHTGGVRPLMSVDRTWRWLNGHCVLEGA